MRVKLRLPTALFQSTLSMRRATDYIALEHIIRRNISIHALHEESDPKAPRMTVVAPVFQSTLSMRRATTTLMDVPASVVFQSTLSMRRATLRVRDVRLL